MVKRRNRERKKTIYRKNKCWNSLNVLKGMQLLMIWMLKWSNGQTVYHFCGIYFSRSFFFFSLHSNGSEKKNHSFNCIERARWIFFLSLAFSTLNAENAGNSHSFYLWFYWRYQYSFECDFLFYSFRKRKPELISFVKFFNLYIWKKGSLSLSRAIELLPDTIKCMNWSRINEWNGAQRHAYHSIYRFFFLS